MVDRGHDLMGLGLTDASTVGFAGPRPRDVAAATVLRDRLGHLLHDLPVPTPTPARGIA